MKKIIKTIILLPVFPLVWLGTKIEPDEYRNEYLDPSGYSCGGRARLIMEWRNR